ncbi:beta strand repeat-containing protein [Brevundimonas lenta]|uniref:Ca2+-binding RTX toxin-like protein n=1 Tax=Brevundimonas lenta TaxID=424796 RepID=A0A7W6JB70_9CAUL|nr:FG-GAP-like repeat-containing protein [Brevundimonas lenta]MBB4081896.1 Ca2+-binding RTX toxin-like protein [Brevundimonas lenta]
MPGAPRFGTVSYTVGTTFNGVDLNENFGVSVASAGDVNNDGVPDLIVGADLDDVGGPNYGSARVISGANGATLHFLTGGAAEDFFGHSVAGAGDVDNDGFDDVIIGAWVADPNGQESGLARVYSGATGAILHTFTGNSAGDRLGVSVASAGDVNGDGRPDLIVGVYQEDNNGQNSGSALVYSGVDGALLHTFNGSVPAEMFGTSVASAGDVDGDGQADLIVGAPGDDVTATNAGAAYVYSGATGALLYTFNGASSGDNFGVSVAGAGDVNGDGRADLIVGANLDDNTGVNSGSARVISGATGATLYAVNGAGVGAQFGRSVAAAGDLDGDGCDDLIVGAPEDRATAGSARIISGATGGTIATFVGDDGDDNFGFSVSSADDLNGDGFDDLIVGADDDETNGLVSGSARTFLSQQTNLLDNAPAFTEHDPGVLLDGDVAIADAEFDFANSYAGGTLTLARVDGANVDDVFAGSGALSLANGQVLVSGVAIGDYTDVGGELVITFNAAATTVRANQVLRSITYVNASHTPPASAAIQITFSDNDPVQPQSVSGVITVALTAVEDLPLAFDDAVSAAEVGVLTGSVFADNGSGADGDFDGPPIAVGQVNGAIGAVGQPVLMASGAVLTVNADGTFTYDHGTLFNTLPGPLSGAANRTFSETFTYGLVTGQVATVTVTVVGEDGGLDILLGTAGADDMDGGAGDDQVRGSAGDDLLDGGDGIDVLVYAGSTSGVSVNLAAGRATNDGQGGADSVSNFENIAGSAFDDLLVASGAANRLAGGAGADTLIGLGGADVLIGGAGAANQLQGGDGDDQYFVTANDSVIELAAQGRDRVLTDRTTFTLGANVEELVYTGAAAFTGRGNGLDNFIAGAGGADSLSGGVGRDVLSGGAGVDRADYSTAAAGVVASLALGAASTDGDGSNDILIGLEDLRGSGFDDRLSGDAGANRLEGQGGGDVLVGRGGADILSGGGGIDTADYAAAAAGVTASLTAATASNDGDGAADILESIENLIGSAFDDLLIGHAQGNILTGGAGRDTLLGLDGADTLAGGQGVANQLFGGLGDDIYVLEAVGDTIFEAEGAGTDTARVAYNLLNLAANVENVVYTGTGGFTVVGNALANVLTGGAGLDTFTGGGGNDTLNGGGGRDIARMSGTAAQYYFADLGDGRLRIVDTVAGRDGIDILNDIEAVRFSDGTITEISALPAPALSFKSVAGPQVLPGVDDVFSFREESIPSRLLRPDRDGFGGHDGSMFQAHADDWLF